MVTMTSMSALTGSSPFVHHRAPHRVWTAMRRTLFAVIAVGVGVAGCSKNAGISAENVIVEELQDKIGLGPLDPECGQPAKYEAGETFTCTATTEDGRVLTFHGEMTDPDTFDVVTSNLLTAEDVVGIRRSVAEAMGPEVDATVDPDDIVCPDDIVVLDDTGDFTCEITDTATGAVYALLISTGGIEPGVGIRKLDFEITEQLR